MKHVGTFLGTAIAGIFVMSVWGAFAGAYGIAGGWFAGFAIISGMWFLNHFVGIINNDGAFVDMACGIAVAGTTRDGFMNGWDKVGAAAPTLGLVVLGGICGGITAGLIQNHLAKSN